MYQIRKGIRQGRGHVLGDQNCQDALAIDSGILNNAPFVIGVIADGCSEGKASEVGANLAANYLTAQIYYLLSRNVPPSVIPSVLYGDLLGMLKDMTGRYNFRHPAQRVNFIKDNLLFTAIGFIITPSESVVFAAGDGVIVINDEVIERQQDNKPTYIAYHMIERQYLEESASALPQGFDVYNLDMVSLQRLAIGSDAWFGERELLDQVWQHTGHERKLQRQMNIWSKNKRFYDDASIVTLEIE